VGYLILEGRLRERDEREINVVDANNIKDECPAQFGKKREKICDSGFDICSFRILLDITRY
jgi:hypothetical protein